MDVVDSLVIGKAIATSLSLDIDTGLIEHLAPTWRRARRHGFDGETLFFEDVRRFAPMDPAATVPDADARGARSSRRAVQPDSGRSRGRGAAARRGRASACAGAAAARRSTGGRASSAATSGASRRAQRDGQPMIANDPHLALDAPSTFYELHLRRLERSPRADERERRRLPGRAGRDPRPERARHLGRHDEPDGRLRRLPARSHRVGRPAALPGRAAWSPRASIGRHPLKIEVGLSANRQRRADRQRGRTPACRSAGSSPRRSTTSAGASGRSSRSTIPACSSGAARPTRSCSSSRASTPRASSRPSGSGTARGTSRVPARARELRLRLAELGLRGRRRQPRVLLERRAAAAQGPRERRGRRASAVLRARRRERREQLGVRPRALPGPVDPVRGPPVRGDAAAAESAERLLREREQRPGRHEPRQRSAEPAPPVEAERHLLPNAELLERAARRPHHAADRAAAPAGEDHRAGAARDAGQHAGARRRADGAVSAARLRPRNSPGRPARARGARAGTPASRRRSRGSRVGLLDADGHPRGLRPRRRLRHAAHVEPPGEAPASVAATDLQPVARGPSRRDRRDARAPRRLGARARARRSKALHHLLSERPFDGVGASGVDFFPAPASLASAADRRDFVLLSALGDALTALASPSFATAFGGSTIRTRTAGASSIASPSTTASGPTFSVPPAGGYTTSRPSCRASRATVATRW